MREKLPHIKTARENVVVIRLLFRAAHDSKQIGMKQFVSVSEQIESISKQLTAWEKSMDKNIRSGNCTNSYASFKML
ncbi:hypothetical protein AGMMS50262_19060 [Bacteroidia bacterium]|nr:hypothetical protein AGMMS50262_19060 [Bacteroidia bacterium]